MKGRIVLLTPVFILVFEIAFSFKQIVSGEAKRHFDQGTSSLKNGPDIM